MEGADDWSHPEIVRNIKNLTRAVSELVTELRNLDTRFVPRGEQELRNNYVTGRLNEQGAAIADLEASLARHQRDHASNWRAWVVPVVTGITVALVAVLASRVLGT